MTNDDGAGRPNTEQRYDAENIQVLEGLKEGDTVILSDMSRWDNVDRIKLE